jgi:anthranilate 1,2-dioxygenase small subunit
MDLDAVVRRLAIEQLYTDYAHCLDADELERWPDFFTDDCRYRITSAENYAAGLPFGIVYATSKDMLGDRVTALRKANIYEPQQYRHIVSCLNVAADGAAAKTAANVIVVRTMQDGEMSLFAVGRYLDHLRCDGGAWKFAEKTVVLDSRRIDTLLAIPL